MKFKKAILYISILTLFSACYNKQDLIENTKDNNSISIKKQVAYQTSKNAKDNFLNPFKESNKFLNIYFTPWTYKKVTSSKLSAMWGLSYKFRTIYLENYRKASSEWFDKQIENSNFDAYDTLRKKAITLKNTNVRVLPTKSPMFSNPLKAGEGFPFDYNQNSLLKINTPLFVSHLSKDRAWAYVESFIVSGWVSINSIAFVDDAFIKEFKTNNYYVAIKEKFPLYTPIFREYIKLGTIFPKNSDAFLIASKDSNQNAKISYTRLKSSQVSKFPLSYNQENRVKIVDALLDEPYGWGGLLNNRDCSSFTQDFFLVFGKFLHRNSKAQKQNGKYIDISLFNNNEKKYFISKQAIPYSTLIYLKGHIMLYIGTVNKEPLVMHNFWSIRLKDKNKKEFRHFVGKTSITTLEPGKKLKGFDDKFSNILSKVKGIIIL